MILKKKRPSLNEIESLLQNELAPEFASLEMQRKQVVHAIVLGGFAVIGVSALTYFLASKYLLRTLDIQALAFPCFATFGLVGFFVRRKHKEYKSLFKEQVMRKVAKRFFPNLSYDPGRLVSKTLYQDSKLFRADLDGYEGGDYFCGKLGEVDFEFSELYCWYETGSGKNKKRNTAFRGFFFVGDFHRDFYFRTTIEPDVAEKFLGVLGRGLQKVGSGSRLVDLEDPEFEKLFVVTSDDQVEARFIITPKFMEKLREFRAKAGNEIRLCFVNGKMYLAITTNHDYFEPNIFGTILSRADLMKFIDMLILLIGVAEEFLHHPKFAAAPPKMPPLPILKK